ncbi:signal recognition particle-docking protein FtsY [Cylindrospermopsis raciborskii CS-508]|uniref:signal recognition particle-docking protein FtsY n=1 Tax=Cylindrospermopsis raciborskii TaxID=77022 RepID=UPI0008DC612D|nr:signal recognition particle-docking protein FtsY [Cylindrospermopsis raciborskii]OHY34181.1 signal recognition particle-docking protein FtsY [Cylindrospermopsis raciborskii CS-508]OHY34740.1 signal recognition particle-docking protein FtsY [Cylindrospermopsis raciborskii CS-508]OHY43420.1 signal recognition particle-docking protein FtsY [Cylindrospermopsis raciborskii CS-508]
MSFNWFRRQHDDSSASTETQVQSETSSNQEVSPESVPETIIDPADLLAYAKAAYKNIQQKQQSQDQEGTTVTSEISEDSSVIKDEIPVTSTDVGEELISDTDHTPPEVGVDGQPQLSFLERATADRQAKQERLIATAVEVPEPETTVMPNVSIIAIPELEFDDGFVWSAEVLAAQGRRAEDISIEEITWLKKLRQGLDKTRRNILNQLKAIVGQGPLNQDAVAEIEGILLQADVGVEATDLIIQSLQKKLRDEVTAPEQAIAYLKQILRDMLEKPLESSPRSGFAPEKDKLTIWLITGVNGAGKTTTIGKIAHLAQKSGYNCLIAAADTFRAAAVEQVKVWGSRSGVEVIANPGKNTDPAAIVFDAIAAAQSRKTELLLVDTAGRLQNKKNLMDELSKIRRIIDKKAADARVESLLVLDSTLGQNGLRQAEVFSQAAQLSGVVLTKLDGTAKGGVALAVVQQLGLPIRFIGAGEGIEDLRPFSSYEFVEALLN